MHGEEISENPRGARDSRRVSKTTRESVFLRDGGRCGVCGRDVSFDVFEAGHIVDASVGGPPSLENLLVMCQRCNKRKPIHRTADEFDKWMSGGHLFRDRVIDYSECAKVRFWSKVDVRGEGECWRWKGASNKGGYGNYYSNGSVSGGISAHRYSFSVSFGEIPIGLYVCHSCGNRMCCNPDHLYLGTPKQNADDAVRSGRIHKSGGERNGKARLKWRRVCEIRLAYASGVSSKDIHFWYDTTPELLCSIVNRRSWNNVSVCVTNRPREIYVQHSMKSESDLILDRIMAGISDGDNGCWNWSKSTKMKRGWVPIYVMRNGKSYNVKRFLYENMIGAIGTGNSVYSLCGNRTCVNPKHLSTRKNVENIQRMRQDK